MKMRPPANAESMAAEVIWVILCAGRSAQAARTIEAKVRRAIDAGTPVVDAFGYRAKAAAIERAWKERHQDFAALQSVLATGDAAALVDWCGEIPFVGDDTKYQLAKAYGAQVLKPDIHVCRLAGIPDRPRLPLRARFARCQAMASEISTRTGDSIPVVDSISWLACNKGVLRVVFTPEGHEVIFDPQSHRGRSIYREAPAALQNQSLLPTVGTLTSGPSVRG